MNKGCNTDVKYSQNVTSNAYISSSSFHAKFVIDIMTKIYKPTFERIIYMQKIRISILKLFLTFDPFSFTTIALFELKRALNSRKQHIFGGGKIS